MRPKPLPSQDDDLFRSRLDAIINARHPLVQLAGLIRLARFDAAFGSLYAETGRPGLPTRLMVGLHLLKHMKGVYPFTPSTGCAMCAAGRWVTRYSGRGFPYQVWEAPVPRIPDHLLECVCYLYPSEAAAIDGEKMG